MARQRAAALRRRLWAAGLRSAARGYGWPRRLLLAQLEQEERRTTGKLDPKLCLVGFLFPRNF